MGDRWALRVETVEDAHYGPMRSCVLYDHDAQVCYVGHSEDGEAALRELADDANEVDRLRADNEALHGTVELLDAQTGHDLVGRVQQRLNAMTYALNQASRASKARRWFERLRRHNDPSYAEAMENLMAALAAALVEAVANGRWAAVEHEEAERLRAERDEAGQETTDG